MLINVLNVQNFGCCWDVTEYIEEFFRDPAKNYINKSSNCFGELLRCFEKEKLNFHKVLTVNEAVLLA